MSSSSKQALMSNSRGFDRHTEGSCQSLNPFIDWKLGVSGVTRGGSVGANFMYMWKSKLKKKKVCPLIFHDFCTIRGKDRAGGGMWGGARAIWCFERLQMALIRTYKICLPCSLRRCSGGARREGSWQEKRKNKRKSKPIQKVTSAKDCLIKIL